MEEKFTKHLTEIGVIDKKTEYQILSFYKQRCLGYQYNKIKFNEIMTEVLIALFNNLSEIQKKYMCFHLPVKFIKLSENKLLQILKNIFLKNSLKIKIILYKYLFRWYKNAKKSSSTIINNKNTFRQRKNMNLNIASGNNKNGNNIDRYINEYFLINNIMRDDNKNNKKDKYKKNYFTLSNEKRSRTYNNPKNKDNQCKLEKNINFNLNYEESIPIEKNINKMIAKNIKKKINKKMKTYDNYFNNNTGESIINHISRVNDNTISSLCDIKDFLMNSNNNTNKKYNKKEQPFSELYLNDLNIMNAYNMKAFNNIGPKISQCNIRKNKILNNKDDFNKQYTKKIKNKNKNNIVQNLIDEDIEKNNSSFTILTKTPKMNRVNKGYFDDVIYYSNKRNLDNDKYSNILNPNLNGNIKQSHSNTHFTTYNRLFEDSKTRIRNQNRKRMQQEKYLDNLSNQISKEKKKVNFDRINYLYKNSDKKNNMEKTKTKVEKEEGLTFKPLIYRSEYDKRIYSNFMERNYSNNKENKDKNLNEFNFANNMNTHKKMSKKQKERIIKGFIDRTNANSLMKSISTCNKRNNKELKNNN
jgi:hypothetical protein